MSDIRSFGETAKGLARNPLGIIALFIVLVYGFASLVTLSTSSLSAGERAPMIYFLVCFPVLVLAVFTWLVIGHSNKLFGPGDFKNEENYIKMQLSAVASLAVASAKSQSEGGAPEIKRIVEVVQEAKPSGSRPTSEHRNRVLWVDDNPNNNIYERKAFEAVGLKFILASSTREALEKLSRQKFAAIISDMGRQEGPKEGFKLLDELRKTDADTPFFVYSVYGGPEHYQEVLDHKGQGCTTNAQELFHMVTRAVLTGSS